MLPDGSGDEKFMTENSLRHQNPRQSAAQIKSTADHSVSRPECTSIELSLSNLKAVQNR